MNANWSNYGAIPIQIDYSDTGLCGGAAVTYNKLVANGADVVIINDSAGGSQQWSNAEINALQAYLNDGHVVIATFATFVSGGLIIAAWPPLRPAV